MSQDEALLIRKLIFAKHSQDATHFCRCVEEIAQTFEQSGERKSACAIRNALHNGYVRSRFELSRQTQPDGCPYQSRMRPENGGEGTIQNPSAWLPDGA